MRSDRKAKGVLRAFGKEAYKERIKYVDSFLPEKTSFIKSVNYRHTLMKVAMVTLVVVLIVALTVSVYAAVMHYLKYTRVEHLTNDGYVPNNEAVDSNSEATLFEPTYIPEGYELESEKYDELFNEVEWTYQGQGGEQLVIWQGTEKSAFNIDNEHSSNQTIMIGNTQAVVYDHLGEITCLLQYENTVITISGPIGTEELELIVIGLNLPN